MLQQVRRRAGAIKQMFGIVQEEQHAPVAEVSDELRAEIARADEGHTEGITDRRHDRLGAHHRREGDKRDPVAERAWPTGLFERQAGFANPTRPQQCDEPTIGPCEQRLKLGLLAIAASKRRQVDRKR
jgi:hypothetical protein